MGYLFDYQFGVVNYYLGLVGIPADAVVEQPIRCSHDDRADHRLATGRIHLRAVRGCLDGGTDHDVLEASQIDGASSLSSLLRIKIPLISPTILFAAVVALINAMQLFDQPYIMTKGGPGTATTTVTIAMYQKGIPELGVWVRFSDRDQRGLLVIILAITGVQFLAARKLVFYQ